jgi:hypothetical protein
MCTPVLAGTVSNLESVTSNNAAQSPTELLDLHSDTCLLVTRDAHLMPKNWGLSGYHHLLYLCITASASQCATDNHDSTHMIDNL